jgi:hypothetical protein
MPQAPKSEQVSAKIDEKRDKRKDLQKSVQHLRNLPSRVDDSAIGAGRSGQSLQFLRDSNPHAPDEFSRPTARSRY